MKNGLIPKKNAIDKAFVTIAVMVYALLRKNLIMTIVLIRNAGNNISQKQNRFLYFQAEGLEAFPWCLREQLCIILARNHSI